MSRSAAATHLGIGKSTLSEWLSQADSEDKYVKLANGLKKAESDFIARQLKIIRKAAGPRTETTVKKTEVPDGEKIETTTKRVVEWTAAAWLLERRHPDQFGKRETEELAKLRSIIDKLQEALTTKAK